VTARDPDQLLLWRARRALALQSAAAITLSMLIVGAIALLVVTHGQRTALEASLRQTAATEEDVVDPPGGTWIFEENAAGHLIGTKDAPAGFPDRTALDRVRAGGPTELTATAAGGMDYLVLTRRRNTGTVQVIGSLAALDADRRRLLAALGMAEIVGLLVACLAAVLLARRATAPLGEALTRQRRFVADASHELRTPLTQLHTRAQLLHQDLRAGASPADMAPDIEQLLIGTRQLGEVVEDLLLSSQLPQRAEASAEVDLGMVAAGVVTALAARARDQDVALALVPDAEAPSVVRGREAALRRVVTALVDNALSHTPAGGHVTVELGSQDGPRRVSLIVRDDGTGFDPADAERIFARFARGGHGDHRRFGLGLALAREVVTGHGGTIEAWGRPGKGASFTIRLPADVS
jgi:two-component system OmpR family sensor kinase